ncbi:MULTISPECIES: metallophosphoesterase [unclassified Paenibacillus]|uniref:metallophosphoesterase n=1 Tax=unclassified Paenibacillus TaxID=185978 RepID=UPI002F41C18F
MYIFLIAAAFLAVFIYVLFILPTKWLKVEKIENRIGLNSMIMQISDVHVDKLRIPAAQLKAIIASSKPDYILLTGDFTSDVRSLPLLDQYLEEIAACQVPAYAVLGNHDYRLPDLQPLLTILSLHHIHVLRNQSVDLGSFYLVGIDDYCSKHSDIPAAFAEVPLQEKPIVVMTHDPNAVLAIDRPYQYLMAGHFHGKQFNIPFLFSIKPKGKLAASGIYKGLHRSKQGAYYISKGLGQAGINARVGVRSEITLHYL